MTLYTLVAPVQHVVEVRHSHFLARGASIGSAADAAAFLREVAVPDATHNCWAWRLGGDYRSSDDGEPAGTAGRPILAAIDGQGFDRVMVVVTRWYGGIKLGTGGLVRAYGGSAAECLRMAPRARLIETAQLQVHVPFEDISLLHRLLPSFSASKLAESFDADGARIGVELPADQADALKTRLRDATRDRARFDDEG